MPLVFITCLFVEMLSFGTLFGDKRIANWKGLKKNHKLQFLSI